MTLQEAKDRQRAIEARIDAILQGRDESLITAEEWDELTALTGEDGTLEGQIETLGAEQSHRAEVLSTYRTRRGASTGRPTERLTEGLTASVAEPEWMRDKEAYGYRGANGKPSARMFFLDVLRSGLSGQDSGPIKVLRVQPEHARIFAAAGSDEASGVSDPYGNILVPSAFSPTLMMVGAEDDPIAGRTMDVPMSTPSLSINARVDKDHTTSVTGGLQVFRRAETDTTAATRMEFEQITLRANPLMGISYATEEILTDSPISFTALLEQGFREEFGAKMFSERLNGTGAGQFSGVFNSGATVDVQRAVAAQIAYADVVNIRARIWRYSGTIWLASHGTIPQLMQMVGPNSEIVWQPTIREDMPDMLLGRPIFFSEYIPDLGTRADLSCINWSQYLEGTYQPMQNAESIHVRFVNNERTFRFTMRNDGQPWWRSPLTPRNQGPTLSPQVVLADAA